MDHTSRSLRRHRVLALLIALLACIAQVSRALGAGDLAREFAAPPDSARMWTWWFWLADRVDKQSITADLEALKAQGIGGVTVYSLSGPGVEGPRGPDFMGSEWLGLFQHATAEADRLGMGVSAMLCSGWNAGGPWITPELAAKRYTQSRLVVKGPEHFRGKLPQPQTDARYYRDVALQAFRLPADSTLLQQITVSSFHKDYPPANAVDGDSGTFWVSNGTQPDEGPKKDRPEWVQLDLGAARIARRLSIVPRPGYGPREAEVEISEDGSAFKTLRALTMEKDRAAEIELPATPLRSVRLRILSTYSPERENVQIIEIGVDRPVPDRSALAFRTVQDSFGDAIRTPIADICNAARRPTPADATAIDPAGIVDLTNRCAADGTIDWEAPEGTWVILRTGCTLTGAMTNCSSPTGSGLEIDPLDPAAIEKHFGTLGNAMADAAGARTGKVFRSVQIDSWENGLPNWSPKFMEFFKARRGYDPAPYLPTLAGWTISSAEVTDRFLHDYRLTLGDAVAENYFGRLGELAGKRGLQQQSEAGGVCCPKVMALDALKNLGQCDTPMGEFWQDGTWVEANQNKNGKQTACAAHLYGKRIAAAEAFTSFLHWSDSPATLKPTADRAFCEGLNWFFIFSSATRSGEGVPGTEYFAGTYFNRKITWWNQARGFCDYIARCSHLLQQGLFRADVLFYNGDGCPSFVSPKHVDSGLGAGYDYDVCNTEVLLNRLSVRDGRIVLPDGMSYRVLALPAREDMPLEVLEKIGQLVRDGATVVGPKPTRTPGLKDYPKCDERLRTLAAELWVGSAESAADRRVGKGRIISGKPLREVLLADGVRPDFECSGDPGAFIDWIHRSVDGTEIYFLANRNPRGESVNCTFRVAGRQPELWDPVSGSARDAAAFTQAEGRTTLPLEFAPHGSMFVIFRRPIDAGIAGGGAANAPRLEPVQTLEGPWKVKFDPARGGPGEVRFATLQSWTERPEEGVRYYSGPATYAKRFDTPKAADGTRLMLDLGEVANLAEVRLNGKRLGTVWTRPFRIDVTDVVQAKDNRLEIDIVNLWPNRLIGDQNLPAEKRLTSTNINFYRKDSPLLPSGLLGPVTILKSQQEPAHGKP